MDFYIIALISYFLIFSITSYHEKIMILSKKVSHRISSVIGDIRNYLKERGLIVVE